MRGLLFRELALLVRQPPLFAALAAHAGVAGIFIAVWGPVGGLPLAGGGALYDQLSMLDMISAAGLLPWVVARCQPRDSQDTIVRLAALCAAGPSSVLSARLLSAVLLAALFIAAALPPVLLAQQMSGTPTIVVALDRVRMFAMGVAVALAARACVSAAGDRVHAWLLATAVIALGMGLHLALPGAGAVLIAGGVIGSAVRLGQNASQAAGYLPEHSR
jgi:hypothetical protein